MSQEPMVVAQKALMDAMAKLQVSEDYADLLLVCGATVYKGHQAIVFSRSHVLEKAWKDTPEEDDPQRVELYEDDDVAVGVGKLVDFLYKLDYDDGSAHSWDIKGCAHKDVPAHKTDSECQLYAIHLSITVAMLGEKYEVGGLQEIASKKFFNALSNIVTKITAGEILEVAKHVYETRSGATIRTIIKQQILDRLSEMMSYTAFRTLVTSNADFAMDLLDHTATIDAGRICRGRHCTFPRETRLVVEVCPSCGDPNYTILHGGAGPIVSDSLKASDNKCAWMDQNSLNVRREWQASTTEPQKRDWRDGSHHANVFPTGEGMRQSTQNQEDQIWGRNHKIEPQDLGRFEETIEYL